MSRAQRRAGANVQATAQGHFAVHLHAAVYHLLSAMRRTDGAPLDETLARYPFLHDYFAELRATMPDAITWTAGAAWWRRQLAAAPAAGGAQLPLMALEHDLGIGVSGRLALMLAGLVEEDARFGILFAALQEPLPHRRPTVALIGRVLSIDRGRAAAGDAWTLCRPLVAAGLVDNLDAQAPRSDWMLRVPPILWDALRGEPEAPPARGWRYDAAHAFPAIGELIQPADLLRQLAQVPALLRTGKVRTVVLRCDPGTDAREVAGALARELGRGLLSMDAQGGREVIGQSALGPWCTLAGAMPALYFDPGPGETIEMPTLSGYGGPVALVLGREGGLAAHAAEGALNLALPPPDRALRRRYWDEVLAGAAPEVRAAVSAGFHLSGGFIRQVGRIAVAQAALNGSRAVRVRDVQEAARSFNHERLDTLADRLEARGDFSHLIVAEATMAKLRELERLCRHRERLLDHLGPAFGQGANRGVRALFSGVSGTGKTMAARMLAAELGMELYRVDLAAVVNKYIGETEKNLSRVLSRAEALDVVLLVDEGDALFGRRTEVRSANDRYANLETNYLLQRLEHYQGIVLVTTNLGENIDRAFQRRMDVVVPFFSPSPDERRTILERHLPTDHRVDAAYLDRACARCALTGGQLRNVALQATLLAIDDGGSVAQRHLQVALQGEYRKAGGIFPLREAASAVHDDGLEAFVAALRAS